MKRSEMINILSRALICPHVIIQPGIEDAFEPKAKRVLELMEEHGMLPPCKQNPDTCNEGCGSNVWEPEDE